VRQVPFEDTTIPVLACDDLMLDAGALDGEAVLDLLRSLLGPADPAVVRLAGLVAR
jgi:hypothetical protein